MVSHLIWQQLKTNTRPHTRGVSKDRSEPKVPGATPTLQRRGNKGESAEETERETPSSGKARRDQQRKEFQEGESRDFPGGPVAKSPRSQCRGPGSIPGLGTRSHMLQLRVHIPQLKVPYATMKIPCAATNARHS